MSTSSDSSFNKQYLQTLYYDAPQQTFRCPRLSFFSRKEIKVFDENIPGFI